jgi:hypothetical protein
MFAAAISAFGAEDNHPPNIIFILADDKAADPMPLLHLS